MIFKLCEPVSHQVAEDNYRAGEKFCQGFFNGAERVRTADLLNANQAFSQLNYGPIKKWAQVDSNYRPRAYQARALTN